MDDTQFWLYGNWADVWIPAVKTALLWLAALAGLRLGSRRVLAPLSAFDVLTLAAIGSLVGRTATAQDTSFVEGVAAIAGLLGVHRAVGLLRRRPWAVGLVEHRPRVLVARGRLDRHQIRRAGLTGDDVVDLLRRRGIDDIATVGYLVYEAKGEFTVIGADLSRPEPAPPVPWDEATAGWPEPGDVADAPTPVAR